MRHSERLSDKPLQPWIVAEKEGRILAAHCNCMAGLGECCSHVASMLWAVEAGVRRREAATVTAKKAYWLTSNKLNDVIYAPVKDIAFVGKKRSAAFHDCEGPVDKPGANTSTIVSPTDAQKMNFLRSLSTSSTKPAVLAVVREFHRSYIPFASHDVFPPILHNL